MTPPWLPPTTELLLAHDAKRERSLQKDMGISSLGGCRRSAGYQLAGVEPEGDSGSVQAIMGTAIHEMAAEAARQNMGIPMHAFVETKEVWFAGLRGHPDIFVEPILRDIKTTGRSSVLESWKAKGPPRRHIWQVSVYAAALIVAGHRVTVVQLDYLARDSGDEWLWEAPFDMQPVREAVAWLANVRQTPLEMLSRDFRPGSPQCQNCQFFQRCWEGHAVPGRDLRTALFADEPDAALWIARLQAARERRKQAERDEADARGALDSLRPNSRGVAMVTVPGSDQALRFSVSKPKERLDKETITADYARAGSTPPVIVGEPSVTISLVKADAVDASPLH